MPDKIGRALVLPDENYSITISIGNCMVSSAIWEKHARVSFSKM